MVIHSQLAAISEIKAASNTSEECEILSRFKRSFLAKRAGALSVLRNLDLRRAVYRSLDACALRLHDHRGETAEGLRASEAPHRSLCRLPLGCRSHPSCFW